MPNPAGCTPGRDEDSIDELIEKIATEFQLAAGRPEAVEAACTELRGRMASPPTASDLGRLQQLVPLLRERGGAIAAMLFSLLEQNVAVCAAPWPLLEGMFLARDHELARRAVALGARLAQVGARPVPDQVIERLAGRVEGEGSPLADPVALAGIATIVRHAESARGPDPVLALFLEAEKAACRRLAARIQDLDGEPAPAGLAERVLGREACEILEPYLRYTRATHLDLLRLSGARGRPPPIAAALRRAQEICGEAAVREVVAELGWAGSSLGLEARPIVGVSLGGSLPFMVSPWEARLLETDASAVRVFEGTLFFGVGGQAADDPAPRSDDPSIGRFRSYSLLHAEVLAELLAVGPLSSEKVLRILERMDAIVEHFGALFGAHAEECETLPGVYGELRAKVVRELDENPSASLPLSAELTRLVQAFEDPRSLAEVRTLHGLKRYLHQRGLQLAFRLVEMGRATNRTLDVALVVPKRPVRRVRTIEYVDFEPGATATGGVPYPVAVVAEGFARQLLHGQDGFPAVRVFCYGNEVHYYLAFLNHPAFLRIDYAPPLRGGMIDLEYFGVSKYELSVHPNPSLDAIRLFFRELEFDVEVDSTHVHARYDKERALDLDDLCRKAEALFRLAPYLMDVDWTIGALELHPEARLAVAAAWARSFAAWGALPVGQLLTRDRRGILLAVEEGPAGAREISWPGEGAYRDRFAPPPRLGVFDRLRASLKQLGLDPVSALEADGDEPLGQIGLERLLLQPLREAIARGDVVLAPSGLQAPGHDLFEREDEAVRFAELLDSDDETLAAGVELARLVAPLERSLRFRTTGDVEGHEVQRARLTLPGESLDLYVLRDAAGMVRLALFTRGESLGRRRERAGAAWVRSGSTDAAGLASLLRATGYLPAGSETTLETAREEAARTREVFRRTPRPKPPSPLPGERMVSGLRASPGRVVGKALFLTGGRRPSDVDGAVLVAPLLRPEDNTFVFHAAGIVSTGGGVLSHAGLIAVQFGKPGLVIPGRWQKGADGSLALVYRTPEYSEEVCEVRGFHVSVRRDVREREYRLREGDLLVLDADAGTLLCLGQDLGTLALHEGLRLLGELSRRLTRSTDEAEVLSLRGRRLHARYVIEKILARLGEPAVARHAVHELLLGEALSGDGAETARGQLLSLLLGNPLVAEPAREHLLYLVRELVRRRRAAGERAEERMPSSSVHEVLASRLDVLRFERTLEGAARSLEVGGLQAALPDTTALSEVEARARCRLEEIRSACLRTVREAEGAAGARRGLRHVLRQLARLDRLLAVPTDEASERAHLRLSREDAAALDAAERRLVLAGPEVGFELHPIVGWKAANLAEAARLAGPGLVPPWFVVTNRAFEQTLDRPLTRRAAAVDGAPPGPSTLREAIDAVLRRADRDAAQKSVVIRALFDATELGEELRTQVAEAYRCLGLEAEGRDDSEQGRSGSLVAIRSSAREEDTEAAARAGEFETFLFIRGEAAVFDHLKRAWSGLWTERAIHNRAVLGAASDRPGGGVIVQRVVRSRVAGVLQTVNVAEGEAREMVINAGLGLGEGIVSGTVAADHILVARDTGPGPLRLRYVTVDKREMVTFDRRRGLGTVRVESLYHQRLRPALEYVELAELVDVARRLEAAYSYPLDIEFGIEASRLWILQVRPVATFLSVFRDSVERHPLAIDAPCLSHASSGEGRP